MKIKSAKTSKKYLQKGFSLLEVTIAVAIVAVLGTLFFAGATRQISKARDSQRKDDLQIIKIAFEDYYNDNDCYPEPEVMQNCGSEELKPYLREIPCDPEDESPYMAESLNDDACSGYRILVRLENTNDPDIELIGCDFLTGCDYGDASYNYGISMGTPITSTDWPVATPTPVPTGGAPTAVPTEDPDKIWVIPPDGACAQYNLSYYAIAGCPAGYDTLEDCQVVNNGCMESCTEDDVPGYLRCDT